MRNHETLHPEYVIKVDEDETDTKIQTGPEMTSFYDNLEQIERIKRRRTVNANESQSKIAKTDTSIIDCQICPYKGKSSSSLADHMKNHESK